MISKEKILEAQQDFIMAAFDIGKLTHGECKEIFAMALKGLASENLVEALELSLVTAGMECYCDIIQDSIDAIDSSNESDPCERCENYVKINDMHKQFSKECDL